MTNALLGGAPDFFFGANDESNRAGAEQDPLRSCSASEHCAPWTTVSVATV